MAQEEPLKVAVIALIRNKEGKYASLWNKHYQGYTLPGGKLNDGEKAIEALDRELQEELGVTLEEYELGPELVWEEFIVDHEGSNRFIIIFETWVVGTPESKEKDVALKWLSLNELCDETLCPFYEVNRRMVDRIKLREKLGYR